VENCVSSVLELVILQHEFQYAIQNILLCWRGRCASCFDIANRIQRKGTCSIELGLIHRQRYARLNNSLARFVAELLNFYGFILIQFAHECSMRTYGSMRFLCISVRFSTYNNGLPILMIHLENHQDTMIMFQFFN